MKTQTTTRSNFNNQRDILVGSARDGERPRETKTLKRRGSWYGTDTPMSKRRGL